MDQPCRFFFYFEGIDIIDCYWDADTSSPTLYITDLLLNKAETNFYFLLSRWSYTPQFLQHFVNPIYIYER